MISRQEDLLLFAVALIVDAPSETRSLSCLYLEVKSESQFPLATRNLTTTTRITPVRARPSNRLVNISSSQLNLHFSYSFHFFPGRWKEMPLPDTYQKEARQMPMLGPPERLLPGEDSEDNSKRERRKSRGRNTPPLHNLSGRRTAQTVVVSCKGWCQFVEKFVTNILLCSCRSIETIHRRVASSQSPCSRHGAITTCDYLSRRVRHFLYSYRPNDECRDRRPGLDHIAKVQTQYNSGL